LIKQTHKTGKKKEENILQNTGNDTVNGSQNKKEKQQKSQQKTEKAKQTIFQVCLENPPVVVTPLLSGSSQASPK
jgi:hypothetical protein